MIRATTADTSNRIAFSNGRSESVADLPIEKGGAGDGFGPHELLEAALATCISMTVRLVASREHIPLQSASCEVRLDRSQPDVVILGYDLSLEGDLTEAQTARLHDVAGRCPVSKTLCGSLRVEALPRG
jgi:putative redox protein